MVSDGGSLGICTKASGSDDRMEGTEVRDGGQRPHTGSFKDNRSMDKGGSSGVINWA